MAANRKIDRSEKTTSRRGKGTWRKVVITGLALKKLFNADYVKRSPWKLIHFHADGVDGVFSCRASVLHNRRKVKLIGQGNGPLAAFVHALHGIGASPFEIVSYSEHAIGTGVDAEAIAYIQIRLPDGRTKWGAGVDTNIELAPIKAILSAVNRATA